MLGELLVVYDSSAIFPRTTVRYFTVEIAIRAGWRSQAVSVWHYSVYTLHPVYFQTRRVSWAIFVPAPPGSRVQNFLS